MKTTLKKKTLRILFTSLVLSILFISCSKDDMGDGGDKTYTTSGNASGSQQNPAVATGGTGMLTGSYDTKTNIWQYTINWNTLSSVATAVQLSGPADAGINGNLLTALSITTPGINGSASGTVTLTEEQETWLLAGRLYYTVITASNISGEIRGQIFVLIR